MWWGAQSCQNSSQCFCFRAAQQRAKLTFDSLLYDQLAGEQIILCKQDLAKLLTFTKAPIIVAVCCCVMFCWWPLPRPMVVRHPWNSKCFFRAFTNLLFSATPIKKGKGPSVPDQEAGHRQSYQAWPRCEEDYIIRVQSAQLPPATAWKGTLNDIPNFRLINLWKFIIYIYVNINLHTVYDLVVCRQHICLQLVIQLATNLLSK